jgi:hypothetical protein
MTEQVLRRHVLARLTPGTVEQLFAALDGKTLLKLVGLPPTAKIISVHTDYGGIALVVEHESYQPVLPGAALPRIELMVQGERVHHVPNGPACGIPFHHPTCTCNGEGGSR